MIVNLGAIFEPGDLRSRGATSDAEKSYFVSEDILQVEMRRLQYLSSLKREREKKTKKNRISTRTIDPTFEIRIRRLRGRAESSSLSPTYVVVVVVLIAFWITIFSGNGQSNLHAGPVLASASSSSTERLSAIQQQQYTQQNQQKHGAWHDNLVEAKFDVSACNLVSLRRGSSNRSIRCLLGYLNCCLNRLTRRLDQNWYRYLVITNDRKGVRCHCHGGTKIAHIYRGANALWVLTVCRNVRRSHGTPM